MMPETAAGLVAITIGSLFLTAHEAPSSRDFSNQESSYLEFLLPVPFHLDSSHLRCHLPSSHPHMSESLSTQGSPQVLLPLPLTL